MEKKNTHTTMKEIPYGERPYEKCIEEGPEGLSDTELLSIFIRTGARGENSLQLAQKILALNYPKGILGLLHLSLPELQSVKGIGKVKAIQLQCLGELSKRIWRTVAVEKATCFDSPESIANYYMEDMRHLEQEELRLMMLNTKNALLKEVLISRGTVNSSIAAPREIFLEALRYHAVNIIMVHNHPSGDPGPSRDDCLITKRVKEAGCLIGIQLIDHIVIGDNAYFSFRERGIL